MALPSGYTQLKYIESSGTQFIRTAFFPSGNALRVEIKFRYTAAHSGLSLFGNHTSTPFAMTVYGARSTFWVGNSSDVSCGPQTEQGVDYTLDATAANGTITAIWNGTKYTAAYSGSLYTEQQMFIFGSNSGDNLAESGSGYRLYSFKIWDNGSLKRNYVPAKNSAGVIGLYDLQLGAFYTNDGDGTFTAGPIAAGPVEGTGVSLLDGVSYGINDGKCLIGGTAYAVTEGKTLADGTGYDISFGPSVVPVTITGTGSSSYCYATINGTTYTEAANGMVVMPGDIITFYVYGASSLTTTSGYVEIDGTRVLTATNKTMKSYQWTVPEGLASINIELFITKTTPLKGGRIFVTTT